jgi:hypothetical protein
MDPTAAQRQRAEGRKLVRSRETDVATVGRGVDLSIEVLIVLAHIRAWRHSTSHGYVWVA